MAQLPEDLQRIVARAGRVIRLAKLRAPAVIIVDTETMLRAAVDRHARAAGSDPDAWRASRAADQAEAQAAPLTSDDEAELRRMDEEMAAYEAAEPAARARWVAEFFPLDRAEDGARIWLELDTSYRSDRVYAVMGEATP